MTISGGGLNVNFLPTPSIYEQQTGAQQELQKQADIGKGNVMIVPQSQQDMIPFPKMAERNTWNYKSESNRPSLLPMGTLRGSGPDFEVKDERWQAHYELLFDELPEEVKEELLGLPTINSEALKLILELAARFMDWQDQAERVVGSEHAEIQAQANLAFGNATFINSKALGKELLEGSEKWLEELGANDPLYAETKEFIAALREILGEL
jgi:hypothetical protein